MHLTTAAMKMAVLAGALAVAAAQSPSIEANGRDVTVTSDAINLNGVVNVNAGVNFNAGVSGSTNVSMADGTSRTLQQMAEAIDALQSQVQRLSTQLADEMNTIPERIDSHLGRNDSISIWFSNLEPDQASQQGFSNDMWKLIGQFQVNSVVDLKVSDGGWCATQGQEFTLVAKWGVHMLSSRYNMPELFSLGTAQGVNSDQFQFFIKNLTTTTYLLYLYQPPYPVCGSDGTTAREHQTRVVATATPFVSGNTFTPETVPIFPGPEVAVRNGFYRLETQEVKQTPEEIREQQDILTGRNHTEYRYESNLLPSEAALRNIDNDLTVLLGKFDIRSILNIQVDDTGYCSGFSQKYLVHARWGLQYSDENEDHRPSVQTYGTSADFQDDKIQFHMKHINPELYYLWMYIPPWSTCGNGTIARVHHANVNIQLSRTTGQTDFAPEGAPAFNGKNGDLLSVLPLTIARVGQEEDINVILRRNTTQYDWTSNQAPGSPNNDLTVLLGEFPVDTVIDVDVGDVGWCSGFSVAYRFSARWGVASHTQNWRNINAPRAFTFGSAQQWMVQQYIKFFYMPVPAGNGYSQDRYYLYMYVKEFPDCGSGGAARPHTTTVQTRAHGSANNAGIEFAPHDLPNPVFNFQEYTNMYANDPSSTRYRPITVEITQMQ